MTMHQTPAPAQAPTTPEGRATEFRAVEGGGEVHSGTVLLVEAYVALWLILFGFIWITFRKQRRLDARIVELENALDRASKEKR